MKQKILVRFLIPLALLVVAVVFPAQANDYPHSAVNDISCLDCHDFTSNAPQKLIDTLPAEGPRHIDETIANNLCWSCHNNLIAPYMKTHSSLNIDEDYGKWSIECRDCHNPHAQEQYRGYGAESYLANGTMTGVTNLSITDDSATWKADEFKGVVVFVENGRLSSRQPPLSYRVVGNTTTTLAIDPGNSGTGINVSTNNTSQVIPGNEYRVIYGKLFKKFLNRPDRGQPIGGDYMDNGAVGDTCSVNADETVFSCANEIPVVTKFLRNFREEYSGDPADNQHAFAGDLDNDGNYQGPCEVCHTRTRHHRNNNSADATPNSQNTSDHTHNVPLNCPFCHKHVNGFLPLGAGAHEVHLTKDFGPKITCSDGAWGCHGSEVPGSNYPNEVLFADSGAGDDKPLCDARLAGDPCPSTGPDTGTQVCANCHGEGAVLAKYYFFRPGSSEGDPGLWVTPQSGEYTWNDTWLGDVGEKKYCGSCHDETGLTPVPQGPQPPGDPPNIVGDLNLDTGANTYGFFVNGHGKETGNYQRLSWQSSSETGNPAAGRICSDCHEYTKTHFNTGGVKRLKDGYENDAASAVCDKCHGEEVDDIATADPQYYTTHAAFESSAHGADSKQNLKCTDCHDPHGALYQNVAGNSETNPAMTKGYKQALCYRCHTDDATSDVLMNVQNFAVTGQRGAHDGADDQGVMTDADAAFAKINSIVGWTIFNLTDGSSGQITVHNPGQITATLSGGTDNDWDTGDEYHTVFQSGEGPVDDIEQAFSLTSKHPLGRTFTLDAGASTYTLNCVSCHNVHLVTGQYWEADQGKTPITRISTPSNPTGNLNVWGDEAGEKMQDYAGGGFYQTPLGDTFDETELPAYPAFCLDCHGVIEVEPGTGNRRAPINWGGDMHGGGAAGASAGSTSPDAYYKATKANNWPRTDDNGYGTDSNYSWPKHQAGRGRAMWSVGAYESADRFVGINYVLSCTDCHEPHGSGASRRMGRPKINGGSGSLNNMGQNCASNCHFRENSGSNNQYTPHPNGGGCGYGSCHGSWETNGYPPTGDSIHGMAHRGSGGNVSRRYDFDEVLDMRFEGNLNDSGTWNMSGQWAVGGDGAGTYAAGYNGGQAIQISREFVDPGVTDGVNWSSGGSHRADRFFQFKYGLAFEAWVNPSSYRTDKTDHYIISKATWGNWADYGWSIKEIDGKYRLYFRINVNGGVSDHTQPIDTPNMCPTNASSCCANDDCGWRGAYSSVDIPKDQWSHVAVAYDASQYGADYDPSDLSKGRIRLYVNGKDVTTNAIPAVGVYEYTQPLDGEGEGENPDVGIGLNTCPTHVNTVRGGWESSSAWCQWRMVIGSYPYSNSGRHFNGKIDDLKIWNVPKDATYFGEINPPRIADAYGYEGDNKIYITFTEGTYANNNGTGSLLAADFVLTDTDNGPILSVQHTPGDSAAVLTLTTNLDATDLDIDTVASAANSIYDLSGTTAALTSIAMVIRAADTLEGVYYGSLDARLNNKVSDSKLVYVAFPAAAYADSNGTGDLQAADFALSCGGWAVDSFAHTAGDDYAVLTMAANVPQSDIGVCTVAPASVTSVFSIDGSALGTTAITLTLPPETSADDLVLNWKFDEGSGSTVENDAGALGTTFPTTSPPGTYDMHGMLTRNVTWQTASTKPGVSAGDNAVIFDRVSDRGAVQLNYTINPDDGYPPATYNSGGAPLIVQDTHSTEEFSFAVWIKPTVLGCTEGQALGLNAALRRDILTTQLWIKNWAITVMRFSPDGDPIAGNCSDDPGTGPYNADETHDVLRFYVSVGDATDPRCDPWAGTIPAPIYPSSPATHYENGWGSAITCGSSGYPHPGQNWVRSFAQTETEASGAPVTVKPGVWQHVVGKWDGRYIRIYIDGELAAETDMGGTGNYVMLADPHYWARGLSRHVSSGFGVGARTKWSNGNGGANGVNYWNANGFYDLNNATYVGELDDVKYWKKALPLTAIERGDLAAPALSSETPVNGASSIALNSNLTFTLADALSGVDLSTLSIVLSGDKGYTATYTSSDVSSTGSSASYNITLDPTTDFGSNEVITVTVNVSDLESNAMTPPAWSFTSLP